MSDIREIDSFSIEYKLLEFNESGRTALCIPVKDPLHKNCWISVDNILKRAHNITYKERPIEVGDRLMSTGRGQFCNKNVYEVLYVSKENAVVIKEGSTKYLAIEVFMPLSQLKDQDLFKRVS